VTETARIPRRHIACVVFLRADFRARFVAINLPSLRGVREDESGVRNFFAIFSCAFVFTRHVKKSCHPTNWQ
jgi:hypothetical protein